MAVTAIHQHWVDWLEWTSKLFIFVIKFNKKMADNFYHDHDMYNFYL